MGRWPSGRPPCLPPGHRKLARSFLSVVARSLPVPLAKRNPHARGRPSGPPGGCAARRVIPSCAFPRPLLKPWRCLFSNIPPYFSPFGLRLLGLLIILRLAESGFSWPAAAGKRILVGSERSHRNFRFASIYLSSEKLLIRAQILGGHG